MTAQPDWGVNYINKIKALINAIEDCKTEVDKLAQDSTLPASYLASPNHRTDLVSADFTNANSALTQVIFAFDSGSPTQKSFLFKMT